MRPMGLRRSVLIAAASAALAVTAVGGFQYGVRTALCGEGGTGSTPQSALASYYSWCRQVPAVGPLTDGRKESTEYAAWHQVDEVEVVYRSGRTAFLLVGERRADDEWKVLGGEGTGP